jgi:hypothetical protein
MTTFHFATLQAIWMKYTTKEDQISKSTVFRYWKSEIYIKLQWYGVNSLYVSTFFTYKLIKKLFSASKSQVYLFVSESLGRNIRNTIFNDRCLFIFSFILQFDVYEETDRFSNLFQFRLWYICMIMSEFVSL